MKKLIFAILSSLVFTLLPIVIYGFIPQKSYAVDRQKTHIECSTYITYGRANEKFEFVPQIYTANKDCKNIKNMHEYFDDYSMKVDLYPMRYRDKESDSSISAIHFAIPPKRISGKPFLMNGRDISTDADINVLKDSIRLIFKTPDGTIFPYDFEIETYSPKSRVFEYKQFYKGSKFPEQMTAHVSFKMTVDGKLISVEKVFPLQLVNEYNLWTMLWIAYDAGMFKI